MNTAVANSTYLIARPVEISSVKVKPLRCNPEYRSLLAKIIKSDKTARIAYAHLMRCGAYNFRPDYMYVKGENGAYQRLPDFDAWNCHIPRFGGFGASMLRGHDGKWFVHS